jgi:hypothetical protein
MARGWYSETAKHCSCGSVLTWANAVLGSSGLANSHGRASTIPSRLAEPWAAAYRTGRKAANYFAIFSAKFFISEKIIYFAILIFLFFAISQLNGTLQA